ncbi:MAG TPA: universal stress protein [Acidimicrobiales bacterium]
MSRILVAVDDSDASRRAAAFVDGFFHGQDDVSIVALNVAHVPVEWMPAVPYGTVAPWPAAPTADRAAVEEAMAREEGEAEAMTAARAPQGAEVEVVFGETVDAILTAAEEEGADLVVVGSNDKGFLQRLFGGSVAEDLTRRSPRPVLVVP